MSTLWLRDLLLWIHVLGMVGALGSLLVVQVGLPRDVRDSAAGARVGARLTNWLLAVGACAGLAVVGLMSWQAKQAGTTLGAHFNGAIGVKFLLLLVAGATVGIGIRKLRIGLAAQAVRLRWVAIGALALAALIGVTL